MTRQITVAVCAAMVLVLGAGQALACDTGSWLMVSGWVRPGEMVPLSGGGLDRGSVVLVWDRSSGPVVGRGMVGADGRLQTDVRIPLDATAGHKIIALPSDSASSPMEQHAWTDVAVRSPAAQATRSPGEPRPEEAPRLAWMLSAVLALAAVAVFVRWRRGRSPTATCDEDLDAELRMLISQLTDAEKTPVSQRRRPGAPGAVCYAESRTAPS